MSSRDARRFRAISQAISKARERTDGWRLPSRRIRSRAKCRFRAVIATFDHGGPYRGKIVFDKGFLVEQALRRLLVCRRAAPRYVASAIEGLFDEIANGVVDFRVGLVAGFRPPRGQFRQIEIARALRD